jgi:hypothetical protein
VVSLTWTTIQPLETSTVLAFVLGNCQNQVEKTSSSSLILSLNWVYHPYFLIGYAGVLVSDASLSLIMFFVPRNSFHKLVTVESIPIKDTMNVRTCVCGQGPTRSALPLRILIVQSDRLPEPTFPPPVYPGPCRTLAIRALFGLLMTGMSSFTTYGTLDQDHGTLARLKYPRVPQL